MPTLLPLYMKILCLWLVELMLSTDADDAVKMSDYVEIDKQIPRIGCIIDRKDATKQGYKPLQSQL